MANFRTTADLLDGVLRRCGEMTSAQGTSPLAADALLYLNQIHNAIICGGTELETDIDESWIWARARNPHIIQLSAPYTTGSVSLTVSSISGTFSVAPSTSLSGWYIRAQGGPEVYRIGFHQAASVHFQLDAAFPQTSYSGPFTAFRLEYEICSQYITIDGSNDTFSVSSTGVAGPEAYDVALNWGTYSPLNLLTEIDNELTADGNNTYGAGFTRNYNSDDSGNFHISATQTGTVASTFSLVGAGTVAQAGNSVLDTLGFDFLNYSGSMSYTAAYPFANVARIAAPARIYYGYTTGIAQSSGQVSAVDSIRFDKDYPLIDVRQGAPDEYKITYEKNGLIRIQFNKYPAQAMRCEFEYVPYPKDLQNNSASVPLLPRKFNRILEYGASYYLLLDKDSDKAAAFLGLAQQTLKGMMKANRQDLLKTGNNFGAVIARNDLMPDRQYRRVNLYGYDAGDI